MIMKNIQALMALLLPLLIVWMPSGADAATGDAVIDTTGQSVETLTRLYNILPAVNGQPGGGVTLSSPNGTCPLSVAQDVVDVSNGFPVLLWLAASITSNVVVTESMALNIMFSSLSVCTESSIWKLADAGVNGQRYVMTGGAFGDEKSWFSIEKYGDNYTLVFCGGTQVKGPNMGMGGSGSVSGCGYVGVYSEGGQQWLVLSDEPFLVRFKRIVGVGAGQGKNEI